MYNLLQLVANHDLLAEKDSLVGAMKSTYDQQTVKVEKKLHRLKEQLENSHGMIKKLNKKASQESAVSSCMCSICFNHLFIFGYTK